MQLFPAGHQRCISAGCGRIDGHRLFGGETRKVMRSASLGASARQAMTAERLHADNSADHVAVDIDVADLESLDRGLNGVVDPGMNAERQPVAGALDCLQYLVEPLGAVAHHMQHRSE